MLPADWEGDPGLDRLPSNNRLVITAYEALAVNDTTFIPVDFHAGQRVTVWQRGQESSGQLVVVVANFSDFGTPDPFALGSEYVVPH